MIKQNTDGTERRTIHGTQTKEHIQKEEDE